MNFRRMVLFCGLALSLCGQDTAGVFKVWHDANGKWFGQNIGTKSITAFVIQYAAGPIHISRTLMTAAPDERENYPILPTQSIEIPAKNEASLVTVPAVILADGTVIGSAKAVEGVDIVDEIFKYRQAERDAYQRLATILQQPDHHHALEDFLVEINSPTTMLNDEQRTGFNRVHSYMKQLLSSLKSQADYSTPLSNEVHAELTRMTLSSTRRAQ